MSPTGAKTAQSETSRTGRRPTGMIDHMADRYAEVKGYGESVEDVEPFRDDHEFIFASGSLRVVHTGHTPGSCCLLRESNRLLLSGDTILKTIIRTGVKPGSIDPARRFRLSAISRPWRGSDRWRRR